MAIGELTQQAIAELRSAIDEVASEMSDLASKVDSGQSTDAEVAAALRASSQRLRDIRPDQPAAG